MMATFSSSGATPSFSCDCSFRNRQDAAPNWSEWTWARKTYCRFLSLKTADETQVVAHMNFFCWSTCWAIGTQCADEKTPMIRSTFSCSCSRVISLIATSALDWASAITGSSLWPSTPPCSLIRSKAISVPTAAAREPPAANGPV